MLYDSRYNNKYTYMMRLDTAISILWYLIQQSHLLIFNNDSASFLMPLWYSWYKTLITYLYNYSKTWHSEYYPWTRRPPARYWRTPHRCAYQERLGGRHATIQDYEFRVIILFFFCFAIYVIRYQPIRRPISREDAHRMYPRYPRVFLYVIIYCPLPHQSLWERLGVSLSCTCAAFSPLC